MTLYINLWSQAYGYMLWPCNECYRLCQSLIRVIGEVRVSYHWWYGATKEEYTLPAGILHVQWRNDMHMIQGVPNPHPRGYHITRGDVPNHYITGKSYCRREPNHCDNGSCMAWLLTLRCGGGICVFFCLLISWVISDVSWVVSQSYSHLPLYKFSHEQ